MANDLKILFVLIIAAGASFFLMKPNKFRSISEPEYTSIFLLFIYIQLIFIFSKNIYIFIVVILILCIWKIKNGRSQTEIIYSVFLFSLPVFGLNIPFINFDLSYPMIISAIFLSPMISGTGYRRTLHSKIKNNSTDIILLLLLSAFLIGQARDNSITHIIKQFLYLSLFVYVPYYITKFIFCHKHSADRAIYTLLSIGLIFSIVGSFESSRNWLLWQGPLQSYEIFESISSYTKLRSGFLRSQTIFGNTLTFGSYFIILTGFTLYLRRRYIDKQKFIYIFLVVMLGLFFTFGRGQQISVLMVVVSFALINHKNSILIYRTAQISILAFLGAFLVMGPSMFAVNADTLHGLFGADIGSIQYRIKILEVLSGGISNTWLFGPRPNEFNALYPELVQGEGIVDMVNVYLATGVTSGMIGLFLLMFLLLNLLKSALTSIKQASLLKLNADGSLTALGRCLTAILIGWMFSMGTTSLTTMGWPLFAVILGMCSGYVTMIQQMKIDAEAVELAP